MGIQVRFKVGKLISDIKQQFYSFHRFHVRRFRGKNGLEKTRLKSDGRPTVIQLFFLFKKKNNCLIAPSIKSCCSAVSVFQFNHWIANPTVFCLQDAEIQMIKADHNKTHGIFFSNYRELMESRTWDQICRH